MGGCCIPIGTDKQGLGEGRYEQRTAGQQQLGARSCQAGAGRWDLSMCEGWRKVQAFDKQGQQACHKARHALAAHRMVVGRTMATD